MRPSWEYAGSCAEMVRVTEPFQDGLYLRRRTKTTATIAQMISASRMVVPVTVAAPL